MASKIIVYGIINHDDSDLFESTGSLTLRTPRNVPNFNEQTTLQVQGNVKQICAGQSHVLTLTQDGNLYSFGSNQFGQRGTVGPGFQLVMKDIANIAVGLYHSVAITTQNKVFVWGRGSEGQLGLGDSENVEKPTQLDILGQEAVCGSFHTLIRYQETCFVFGENQNGQLGILGQHDKPAKLNIQVEQMAAGLDHSLFLYKGQVYVTGNNLFGQCGLFEQIIKEPIKLNLNFEVQSIFASMGTFSGAISKQGKVYIWGTGSWGYARKCTPIEELCKINEDQKITQVITGENFAMIKCFDGWYVFGMNKMPESYPEQTHRIQLTKVNLAEGQIYAGLNVIFSCCYNNVDIQKQEQTKQLIEQTRQCTEQSRQSTEYSKQLTEQDYRPRSTSYKLVDLKSSGVSPLQQSSKPAVQMIPPSALRMSQQLQEYQSNKMESKPMSKDKINELQYRSDNKVPLKLDLKIEQRSDSRSKFEIKTPDLKDNNRQDIKKLDSQDLRTELKQELLKLEKKQEQFKYEIITQQQQLDRKNENLKEITFGLKNDKSDIKPLQERSNNPQKCFDCQHQISKNEYYQKQIKFQEDEILNLKKELDILKSSLKQKDTYISELETRIMKYQENTFKSNLTASTYKPTMEIRLKSEEKQLIIDPKMQKVEYTPKVFRQPTIIEQSPKERCFNTSIIDKIQSYQQSAKATRPTVHQNLVSRYSAHEVPQNGYVIPQYFKRN